MNSIHTNLSGSSLVSGVTSLSSLQQAKTANGQFADTLLNSLQQVNNLQQDADRAVEALFTGQGGNPAEVLTAVQKADLAFRTMMQIRNKLMAAYDEIKNIRV
ncbi:MAG: flagellar hook-basal body complex protein FliE [Pirellulales bacterium]|nr:flagellar hook-basal body complex protein FliE [Pirellulales bacterium]